MESAKPIIEIKNIGKHYNIIHQRGGYVTLREAIMNVLGSPVKYLKNRVKKAVGLEVKEEFWALKNINLEIKRGEVIGIIGPNGSGKSTLLKILSQITPPTTGEITLRGNVGSLLEVGTGFHGELSGRENIFLNGAILGMPKKEIAAKFDKIVEFAGVEQFLDTPVKYYSSGMYVRLAFSVAAHMEPDILIVDEVLAVGDAEFQKKCLGKMDEITKQDGRTILFVSHNMAAIEQLCTRCVLLKKGEVVTVGNTHEVIKQYIQNMQSSHAASLTFKEDPKKEFQMLSLQIKNAKGEVTRNFTCDEDIFIELECVSRKPLPDLYGIFKLSKDDVIVLASDVFDTGNNPLANLPSGRHLISLKMPKRTLGNGVYGIILYFASRYSLYGIQKEDFHVATSFQLHDKETRLGDDRPGYFSLLLPWKLQEK